MMNEHIAHKSPARAFESRPLAASFLHSMRLERSDLVLWSLAPSGIVLHHTASGSYLELDDLGYLLWGLLDGARTVEEVIMLGGEFVANSETSAVSTLSKPRERMEQIVATLLENEFIEEMRG